MTGRISIALFAAVWLCLPHGAAAQQYPVKPVRMVVPFPAGTGADVVARVFAPRMAESAGQQFVVDNRGGAAGNIGAEAVARAPADGYTLLVASASIAVGQSVYKNLRFDLARDFEAIASMGTAPFVLVVHPSLPVKSVKDFVALAKARPGQLTFASSGTGSSPHLTGEMLKLRAGIDMLHIPYQGSSQALIDVMAGRVTAMFTNTVSALPQINSGRLRALAVSGATRSAAVPSLPTVAESVPGFESSTWWALLAPAGVPREVVTRVHAAVVKAGQSPEVRSALAEQGGELSPSTPGEVAAHLKAEIAKWAKVVAASNAAAN